jgi:hypothetical protein
MSISSSITGNIYSGLAQTTPDAQTQAKADRKKARQAKRQRKAEGVMGAIGNFAKAVAAGLEAEGRRRGKLGFSGAGFAAAFSSGIEGLTDYTDMLQGNAAPGTVLFDAAMKSAEDKNKKLESKGVGSLQVDEDDEEVGGVPDLLARPVETEEADVVPNTIRQAVQEGLQEGTQGADAPSAFQAGPPRPANLPFNMLASVKRYNPQTFEQVVAIVSDFGPDPKTATPSEQLAMRQTSPEMRDKGMTRVAPGAVGSAPQNLVEGGILGALFQQASPKSLEAIESTPTMGQDLQNFLFRLRREGRSFFGMDDR